MKKNVLFISVLVCTVTAGCKLEVSHPPHAKRVGTCSIYHNYNYNVAYGAIEPAVTCVVDSAEPNAAATCSMEFRAGILPVVIDRNTVFTDFFGDAEINISNGNCYAGEVITLHAECMVDGNKLNVLSTGPIYCGD